VDRYILLHVFIFFFFSSRRRHTRSKRDWSSDVCSSDLTPTVATVGVPSTLYFFSCLPSVPYSCSSPSQASMTPSADGVTVVHFFGTSIFFAPPSPDSSASVPMRRVVLLCAASWCVLGSSPICYPVLIYTVRYYFCSRYHSVS